MARRLATVSFSALYSSDLGRAMHTARIISDATGHEVTADPRLRERNVGVLQGLTMEQMESRFPKEFAAYRKQDREYVIPHGESAVARAKINLAYLEQIARKHPGDCVVVVTHGGVLNNMFLHVLKITPNGMRNFKIFNAAFNRFSYLDGGWMLHTWGDISHYHQGQVLDEVVK